MSVLLRAAQYITCRRVAVLDLVKAAAKGQTVTEVNTGEVPPRRFLPQVLVLPHIVHSVRCMSDPLPFAFQGNTLLRIFGSWLFPVCNHPDPVLVNQRAKAYGEAWIMLVATRYSTA